MDVLLVEDERIVQFYLGLPDIRLATLFPCYPSRVLTWESRTTSVSLIPKVSFDFHSPNGKSRRQNAVICPMLAFHQLHQPVKF